MLAGIAAFAVWAGATAYERTSDLVGVRIDDVRVERDVGGDAARNVALGASGAFARGWATYEPSATPTATPTRVPSATATRRPASPLPVERAEGGGGASSWRAIVCGNAWPCEWALAVIQCESGGDPNAYNPAGPYIGLFQIWNGSYDVATNVAQAWALYSDGGNHWPNCP